ncbi:GL12678 [Drosophila persimilis]|uniref:GL12678 n=1 Tax=Drosophila persimilis TaxID=7234 RepID=B4GM00_DROPE|nr:THO complex subunit 4 [Drosophila persimilis]EDW38574.1 GL12678 [Drosophila persimilis]
MVDKIEMSLDDIIKSTRTQKKPQGARGGPGGARRPAGQQRFAAGGGPRRGGGAGPSPRKPAPASGAGGVLKGRRSGGAGGGGGGGGAIQKAKFARGDVNSAWKHDMYDGPKRGAPSSGSGPTLLIVNNLDYGVSNSDIKELFNEFGPIKKAAVHYDRSGRSLGTADVIFERRTDALKAIKQYNGVPLDGRPMTIQLAVSDVNALTRPVASGDIKHRVGGGAGAGAPYKRGGGQAGGPRRGGLRRPAPGGGAPKPAGGARRERKAPPTAEELDAELDSYINDMKI